MGGYLYATILLLGSYLGTKAPYSIAVSSDRDYSEAPSRLFKEVLPSTLECIHFQQSSWYLKIAIVILLLFSFAVISWGLKKSITLEKEKLEINMQVHTLAFFTCSLTVSLLMSAVTQMEISWRYSFMLYFVISFAIALSLKIKGIDKLQYLVITVVCILALGTWKNNYFPYLHKVDFVHEYEQIAEWMLQNDCTNGYSTFDTSNAITVYVDGKVQVSAVASMEKMNYCKWLTDKNWYVPNQDTEQKTAYIVPKVLEEQFAYQRKLHSDIKLGLETNNYYIYISPYNYSTLED